MKQTIDFQGYDTLIQPTEWRYSAAVLGLLKYLEFEDKEHEKLDFKILCNISEKPPEAISGFDGILYHSSDLTEERFLDFAEHYFSSEMTHCIMLNILENSENFDDDKIKTINNLVNSKVVLKNIFGKTKFDGSNKEFFISAINSNRHTIIKEIFRYSYIMYRGFSNTNLLFTEKNNHCRLQNYNVDEGRKTRYLGFNFDKESFVGDDIKEFDFIPFSFTKTSRETYFINNNFNIETLKTTENELQKSISACEDKDDRTKLYNVLKNSKDFVQYDVEIIIKPRDKEIYRTLFVRTDRIKALQDFGSEKMQFTKKINNDCWFNLENELYERCLNNVLLNDVIELMLKYGMDDSSSGYMARLYNFKLIEINEMWRGSDTMKDIEITENTKKSNFADDKKDNISGIETAKKVGYLISKKFTEDKNINKLMGFKNKLIGAITAHDYRRMNEILLNLSAYSGVELKFAYPLFENPEENIGLAYSFVNALSEWHEGKNNKEA